MNLSIFHEMAFDITTQFNRDDFVRDTYEQIQKDMLGLVELEVEIDSLLIEPYPRSLDFLVSVLEKLTANPDDKLAQFAYRVDLNQEMFLHHLHAGEMREIAHMILRREAQKVYLRKKFSSK